jgi:two-component system sensor histidine kinase QseC
VSRLLIGTAAVLLPAGVAVWLVAARALERQFDRNLADRVQALASLLFQVENEVELAFSDELMPEYSRPEAPDYFELRHESGKLLELSESLRGVPLEVGIPGDDALALRNGALPDGRAGRFAVQWVDVHHVYPEEGPQRPETARVHIVVARGRESLVAAERMLAAQCAGTALLLGVVLAVLALRTVDRGLKPALRLAGALGALDVDRLPERLDVGVQPLELRPVADTAQALVRRVADALERERRTTADIAHELRTPIAEVLAVAEVALRNGHDTRDTRASLAQVRDLASGMGRTLTTLLKLARLEMGAEAFREEAIDPRGLIDGIRRPLRAAERDRGLRLEVDLGQTGALVADGDVLRIVLSNLLGNAVHHAPEGSTVHMRVGVEGAAWHIDVENEAPGLEERDLVDLARPFWRKHGQGAEDHAGLGLALSRALADHAGLGLGFELVGRGRLRARIARARGAELDPVPRSQG